MVCGGCNKPLGQRILTALEKKWHPECFVCCECSEKIAGGFGVKNGKPVCKTCHSKSAPPSITVSGTCGKCDKPLSGSIINAMGKSFHKDCFVCTSCGGNLQSGFGKIDGQPYCKDCLTRIHSEKQKQAQKLHEEKLKRERKTCNGCGEAISGKCLNVSGKFFHPTCFKCKACEIAIDGSRGCGYINGHVHCSECIDKLSPNQNQSGKKCPACGEVLSGNCIKVMEKMFHQKCFTCSVCKKSIEKTYKYDGTFGDAFYCTDCYKNRPGACTNCGLRKAGGQYCGGCGTQLWETF